MIYETVIVLFRIFLPLKQSIMKNSGYTYDYFLKAFDEAKVTATNMVSETDNQMLTKKPDKESWSMIEILNHLVQAGNEYLPQIKKALDKDDAKLTKGSEPFTPGIFFRWFIGQVSPENPRKLPTVSSFKPVNISKLDIENTLTDFLALQDAFIHILKRAKLEGLDLNRIKAKNPIIKIIPMSLTACFGVADAHQRRHFDQMRILKDTFLSQDH